MTYSIIKVEGLSMKPFLKTHDYVLIDVNPLIAIPAKGSCVYSDNKVHRLIDENQIKGDRLIYVDHVPTMDRSMHLVLGRVLSSEPQLVISNYKHPILQFLSKCISIFSNHNRELNRLRPIYLICLITFSTMHRKIEKYFLLTEASQ